MSVVAAAGMDGWIGQFCPSSWELPPDARLALSDYPAVVGQAPVRWKGPEGTLDLEFHGGLLGVEQRLEDLALCPKVGWAVSRSL